MEDTSVRCTARAVGGRHGDRQRAYRRRDQSGGPGRRRRCRLAGVGAGRGSAGWRPVA